MVRFPSQEEWCCAPKMSSARKYALLILSVRLLTIPNIAIHLQKEMNQGVELNRQTQMIPLLGTLAEGEKKDGYFAGLLAKEMGVKAEDILEYELNVYNIEDGCLTETRIYFCTETG